MTNQNFADRFFFEDIKHEVWKKAQVFPPYDPGNCA